MPSPRRAPRRPSSARRAGHPKRRATSARKGIVLREDQAEGSSFAWLQAVRGKLRIGKHSHP